MEAAGDKVMPCNTSVVIPITFQQLLLLNKLTADIKLQWAQKDGNKLTMIPFKSGDSG